eukprot:scaffold208489_cov39-Tisochrysis_lutea.AAC.4
MAVRRIASVPVHIAARKRPCERVCTLSEPSSRNSIVDNSKRVENMKTYLDGVGSTRVKLGIRG